MKLDDEFLLYSLDAEMTAIASCLFGEKYLQKVRSAVSKEDFYFPAHREIYDCIETLYEKSIEIDPVTLRTELSSRGKLELVGGDAYIMRLQVSLPSPAHAHHYSKIVRDYAVLRRLEEAGGKITNLVRDVNLTIEEKIEQGEKALSEAKKGRLIEPFKVSDMNLLKRDFHVETGFTLIDNTTGGRGFVSGRPVVIGASSGLGKTTLGLDIALNMYEAGRNVLWYTLGEMDKERVIKRLIRKNTECEERPETGPITAVWDKEYERLFGDPFKENEFRVFDAAAHGDTANEVISNIESYVLNNKVDAVFVDYFQLIDTQNRDERLGLAETAKKFRILARDFRETVFVIISQTSQVDLEDDHPSSPFGSGEVHKNCNMYLTLRRKRGTDVGKFVIEKNSHGPEWVKIKYRFERRFTRHVESEWQDEE